MSSYEFAHLLAKARDVANGGYDAWSVQSTGEKVAVAMVFNRFDWLEAMDYTIAEAILRVGPPWLEMIPRVARIIRDEAGEPVPS